jgi:hypothetical protein
MVPPAELLPSLFEWCQIQTCQRLASPFPDHLLVMVKEKTKQQKHHALHQTQTLLAMSSSNIPIITRVPAGTIVDEIIANSSQSSFDLTASSGSGSDDTGHDDEVVVVDTLVNPDDGNSGILIENATLDDVQLW